MLSYIALISHCLGTLWHLIAILEIELGNEE